MAFRNLPELAGAADNRIETRQTIAIAFLKRWRRVTEIDSLTICVAEPRHATAVGSDAPKRSTARKIDSEYER